MPSKALVGPPGNSQESKQATQTRKTCIIGAGGSLGILGSIALGIGSRDRLILVCRPHQMDAIANDGLHRSGLLGEASLSPDRFELYGAIDSIPKDPLDDICIFVKCYDVESAADQLARRLDLISEKSNVFCFQNGYYAHRPLLSLLRPEQVFHARVITGAYRTAPNRIEVTAHQDAILIGGLVPGAPLDASERLAAELTRGGVPARCHDDIDNALWRKLTFNAAISGLSAIYQLTIGELVDDPDVRPRLDRLLQEIFRISVRAGRCIGSEDFEGWRDHFYNKLVPLTGHHRSSMAEDLARDVARPKTEVDFINGPFIELAREYGEAAPENEWIVGRIHAMENERRRAKSPQREESSPCEDHDLKGVKEA